MTGPLNPDLIRQLQSPSTLATKDEEEEEPQAVTGPLDLTLLGKLARREKGPQDTGQELIAGIQADAIARVGQPVVAPYDRSVFEPRPEAPPEVEKKPTIDELLEIGTFAQDVTGAAKATSEVVPGGRPSESRRQRLERQRAEYLRSPEKIAADLASDARIEAAPTGFAKARMKLASMRLFTDRSIVEFDLGNSSGFHIGTPIAHPLETAKELITGIPKFFVDLVRQPAALALDQIEPGGYLLPEEREQYKREVVANYAGLVMGYAAGRTVASMRVGNEFLRTGVAAAERAGVAVPIGELEAVAQTVPRALAVESTIPGQIVTGSVEGAVGGATTGSLLGETPEERRNFAATYALMALPAGIAFEGVMGRIRGPRLGPMGEEGVAAHNLSIIRQMQAASQQSLLNAENSFLALRDANDLAMAAETVEFNRPVVVQGVTKFRPSELSIMHQRPDGKLDISFGGPPEIAGPPTPPKPEGPPPRPGPNIPEAIAAQSEALTTTFKPGEEVALMAEPYGMGRIVEVFGDEYTGEVSRYRVVTKKGEVIVNSRDVASAEAPGRIEIEPLVGETVYPEVTPEFAKAHFQATGFFPHEVVGFLGNDYHYVEPVFTKKGVLEAHRIADASGNAVEVPWNQLRHGPDMAVNSFILDAPEVRKAIVSDFEAYIKKVTGSDQIPNKPFGEIATGYADFRRLNSKVVPAFVRFLSDEYGKRLRDEALSPQERVTYNRLVKEASSYRESSASNLVDAATSNGMYIERQNGALIIRDSDTNSYLELAHSPEEALRFIQQTVELRGADLTPAGLPDGVARGLIPVPPPPNGPHTSAWNPLSNGWFGDLRDAFNISKVGSHLTGMRQVMISLDNTLKTGFFSEVYQPLQVAHLRKYAAMHKDMVRLSETSRLVRGLTPEQLEQITTSIETMHPDDMIKEGGLFNRAFTPRELAGAKWFIENQIDVQKAFQYFRGLKRLENNPRFWQLPEGEKTEPLHRLQASLNVDEAHIEAARIMGAILQHNKPGELSLYGVVRLSEAVMDGHVRPDDYIAKNFPAADTEQGVKMRMAKDEIRSHFDDLADTFEIPDEQRLGGYFAHLRNFKNDEIIAGRDGAPVFTSELLRTGEMSEYDRDPINVLARYINSGYSNRFTKEALNHAYEYINRETARMPDPAHGDYVKRLLTENYINELRGIPHASTSFVEKAINKTLDKMGMESEVSVRRDIVNTWLSLSSSATIGFRPMQGIRDFHNFSSIYYSRFGAQRLGDLYTMMARVNPQELERAGIIKKSQIGESSSAALSREGVTPTMGPVSVLTAQERLQNSLAARSAPWREAIQTTANAGIKWGLQHNVYQWAHAASYLESSTRALSELNKLALGEYGTGDAAKAKAYDRLFLNSYDPPVAAHFDRLVTEGRFKDAADFMGRATSFETVSTFGLANHPAGWGTNTGRLFGQFGNWPVWARTTLARMLSRGTRQEKTGVAVRWGMTQGALAAASAGLGLNLNSWMLPTAAPLFSAGQHLAAATDSFDEEQTRELQLAAQAIVLGVPGSTLNRGGPVFGLIGSAISSGQAFPSAEREGVRTLTELPLMTVPGGFLLRDIYEGAEMAANGDNPVSAWLRAFGVRSKEDESLLNPGGIVTE